MSFVYRDRGLSYCVPIAEGPLLEFPLVLHAAVVRYVGILEKININVITIRNQS